LYTTLLADATLFEALLAIDDDLATTAHAGGCLLCGGRVDHADYPRKPRGGPATLGPAYDRRFSFCCDACRKRLTPVSVRFLGRKVYLGVVVLLATVLRHGPTVASLVAGRLRAHRVLEGRPCAVCLGDRGGRSARVSARAIHR